VKNKPAILFLALMSFCTTATIFKTFLQRQLSQAIFLAKPDLEPIQVSLQGNSLKKISFGFNNALASLIWIRLLQGAKHNRLLEDKLSWEFSEVDAVTTLDPQFDTAYQFGALFVSFFRRDKEGGKRILTKWTKRQPGYWKPHHSLGMHYFLELNDYQNAAPHILKAAQLPGAPAYISSLGIGLLTQAGAEAHALKSAVELFGTALNAESKYRLARRIRGLRWKHQKENWETALTSFFKNNPKQKPGSIDDLLPYYPKAKDRSLSSVIESSNPTEELQPILKEIFQFKLNKKNNLIESRDPRLDAEFKNLGVYLQKDG